MMHRVFFFLLILISSNLNSKAQLSKFSLGLNAKLAFLTHIESKATDYFDINHGTPKDIIFNTPFSIRYTASSKISLRYQIEYRREMFHLLDKYSDSEIESACKYLINSLQVLLKVNKSEIANTSISAGVSLFHILSEIYHYKHYGELNPGAPTQIDSMFSYSTSQFKNIKRSVFISVIRETIFKNTRLSLYREFYLGIPIYRYQSTIPIFDSVEFGFTVGLNYNFSQKRLSP